MPEGNNFITGAPCNFNCSDEHKITFITTLHSLFLFSCFKMAPHRAITFDKEKVVIIKQGNILTLQIVIKEKDGIHICSYVIVRNTLGNK